MARKKPLLTRSMGQVISHWSLGSAVIRSARFAVICCKRKSAWGMGHGVRNEVSVFRFQLLCCSSLKPDTLSPVP